MSGMLPDDIVVSLRDPNIIAPLLPTVERQIEEVNFIQQP
jgi:hypothetical protein